MCAYRHDAPAGGRQAGNSGLYGCDGGLEVRGHHGVPDTPAVLLSRAAHVEAADGRNDPGDLPEMGGGLLQGMGDAPGIAEIEAVEGQEAVALPPRLRAAVEEHDVGAALVQ